jgi:hypothetical protein
MSEMSATTLSGWRQLDYLPVSFFGSVMGLTGLSIAWRLAHAYYMALQNGWRTGSARSQ